MSHRSDFAGSGIYALFEEPERLDDEFVDGKDGDNETEAMVTRSDDWRPLFLDKTVWDAFMLYFIAVGIFEVSSIQQPTINYTGI